jgi:hypothetical protein
MGSNVDASAILDGAVLDPKRQATKEDVAKLVDTYHRLLGAEKALQGAKAALDKALATYSERSDDVYQSLAAAVEVAAHSWVETKIECRRVIDGLPNGVTGPGGQGTKQTLVMQFYAPVNRDLKARLTPAEARRINAVAFGR